jgi:hypothetical protein
MVTGSELTANDWNNHSKELENVVSFSGLSLSSNENDLARAIDIFSKSNIYDTTNSGNDYTIMNRGLSVEELKSGMILFVRFNKANTNNVRLNFGNGFINVKNLDSSYLTGMRFKDGTIIPLYYNGTDFISTKYLYKYINNNPDGFFNFYSDDDVIISNYVEWNDDYLTNPTHKLFIVRGNIVNNILFCEVILFTEGDLKDNNAGNVQSIKIDLGSFFNDKFTYDLKFANYQTGTCVITAEDTNAPYLYASCPLFFNTWKNGSTNSNKIVTNLGNRGWKWDTSVSTQYNKLRFDFQVNVKLEDI